MIEKLLNATIGLGSFIWLVIGSIYVFGVDPISFEDPNMPDYCDYAPYMYAYVMTIIGEDHHLNIESTMQIIFSQKCTFEQGKCLGNQQKDFRKIVETKTHFILHLLNEFITHN